VRTDGNRVNTDNLFLFVSNNDLRMKFLFMFDDHTFDVIPVIGFSSLLNRYFITRSSELTNPLTSVIIGIVYGSHVAKITSASIAMLIGKLQGRTLRQLITFKFTAKFIIDTHRTITIKNNVFFVTAQPHVIDGT
jgi:hypothetical protein